MRVVVTGGTGFIGRAVVRQLRARGDSVVAIVRDPLRAGSLSERGAEIAPADVAAADVEAAGERLAPLMSGADGAIHLAGDYRVGIPDRDRPGMFAANVTAVANVIDAAVSAAVARIVVVSTANVLGNTHGRIVDEKFRRDPAEGFLSWYDETKVRGRDVALERIARGAPVTIAMPGTIYGPGDHSAIGQQLRLAFEGGLRYRVLDDVGVALTHVDDEAAGIIRVLDGGRIGEAYGLLAGTQRLRDALEVAARLGGHRIPRLRLPTPFLRAFAPLAPVLGGRLMLPPNMREVVRASAGVTYWMSADKARRELGFTARDLETGLRDWLLDDDAG